MRQKAYEDPGYFRDFDGNHCKDGDVLVHPDGSKFTLIKNGDIWLADYGDQSMSFSNAWLQVGSKGMAVKAGEVKKEGLERAQSTLKAFIDLLQYSNEKSSEVEANLSERGWYFGLLTCVSDPLRMATLIQQKRFEEVDDIMADHIRRILDWIEEKLIKYNPKRESIFRECFLNHREGRYYSSACLLLSQVDGMCYDRFQQSLFTINRKTEKPLIAEHIQASNFFYHQFKSDFFDELRDINRNFKPDKKDTVLLNRHKVLHGYDTNYGIEINSLRIISFVNFINEICYHDELGKYPGEDRENPSQDGVK
jgi:hypothetical protein